MRKRAQPPPADGLKTREEAAAYLRISLRSLYNLKRGPKAVLLGRRRLYRQADLDAFLKSSVR